MTLEPSASQNFQFQFHVLYTDQTLRLEFPMESLNRPTSLLQASAHSHSPPSTYTAFPARFSYPHQPPPLSSARRSVLQMSSQTAAPTVSTVTISYPELKVSTQSPFFTFSFSDVNQSVHFHSLNFEECTSLILLMRWL